MISFTKKMMDQNKCRNRYHVDRNGEKIQKSDKLRINASKKRYHTNKLPKLLRTHDR